MFINKKGSNSKAEKKFKTEDDFLILFRFYLHQNVEFRQC